MFKGDDKWFEPTIPFDEDGKLLVPKNLSPAYVPIMKKTEHLYTQVCPLIKQCTYIDLTRDNN